MANRALPRALAGILMIGIVSGGSASRATAATAGIMPEYRITAGDELDVMVWGEERMQRPVKVLPDGTFAFPLAGTITAEGRTAIEVGGIIADRIKGNYRAGVPNVTVAVRDTGGSRFYVVGKVRTPGGYSIGRAVNVVQALSLAGGTVEFADVDNAVILRQTDKGQSVERVRLADVLKGSRGLGSGPQAKALPVLGSGDVLVIP